MRKSVHVGEEGMQQIIGFAGQRKAAQHLRPRLYGGGKFFACNLGLADGYADKRLKAEFDGDGGEQGGILADDTCVFKLLEAAQDRATAIKRPVPKARRWSGDRFL